MTASEAIGEIQKIKSYEIDDIKNVLDKVDIIDTYASEDVFYYSFSNPLYFKKKT